MVPLETCQDWPSPHTREERSLGVAGYFFFYPGTCGIAAVMLPAPWPQWSGLRRSSEQLPALGSPNLLSECGLLVGPPWDVPLLILGRWGGEEQSFSVTERSLAPEIRVVGPELVECRSSGAKLCLSHFLGWGIQPCPSLKDWVTNQ